MATAFLERVLLYNHTLEDSNPNSVWWTLSSLSFETRDSPCYLGWSSNSITLFFVIHSFSHDWITLLISSFAPAADAEAAWAAVLPASCATLITTQMTLECFVSTAALSEAVAKQFLCLGNRSPVTEAGSSVGKVEDCRRPRGWKWRARTRTDAISEAKTNILFVRLLFYKWHRGHVDKTLSVSAYKCS